MANPLICVFNPVTTLIDRIPSTSTGPSAPGTPVVTNLNGVLDASLLGQGVIATAGQNLSSGNLVALYSQAGALHMQLASAASGGTAPSGATYPVPAAGFVSSQIFTGFPGVVSFSGTFVYIDGNSEFSATDIGTIVFLSAVTPGGVTKTPPSVNYNVTSVNNAVGANTTYNGAFTAASLAGFSVTISGFVNPNNNGTFQVISNNATMLVLSNPSGVAETHAAMAAVNEFTQSVGYVVGFTVPNQVTIAFSAAFLDFNQINGILPIQKGGTGATTAPAALDNLIGGAPSSGDVLVWNGSAWVPSSVPFIGGTIAATQVAYGSGVDTITGNNDLTYAPPTLTFRNTAGINTTPSTITKDMSDNLTIATDGGTMTIGPTGSYTYVAGSGGQHPTFLINSNGSISLSGSNTGTLIFLEGAGGFQAGQNQISFNMFRTGPGPHGVWVTDNGSRASVFMSNDTGSVYMQNIVGVNNALTQVTVAGPVTTYTGTFPTGGSNMLAGMVGEFSGFTNLSNNGVFTITGSTGTALTVATVAQVNETHAGTVIINANTPTLTLAGSKYNGVTFVDDVWAITGVTGVDSNPGSVLTATHNGTAGAIDIAFPFDHPGLTASIGPLNLVASVPATGMYRVSVYEECTVAGASGGGSPFGSGVFGSGTFNITDDNVQTTVTWTDDAGVRNTTPIPTPLDLGQTNSASGDVFIRAVAGSPITFRTSLANTGAPTYGVFVRLEPMA
jgi:hypothetical protein